MVAGKVCMDMCMVDLGAKGGPGESVRVGDYATLWGDGGNTLSETADGLGTAQSDPTCYLSRGRAALREFTLRLAGARSTTRDDQHVSFGRSPFLCFVCRLARDGESAAVAVVSKIIARWSPEPTSSCGA